MSAISFLNRLARNQLLLQGFEPRPIPQLLRKDTRYTLAVYTSEEATSVRTERPRYATQPSRVSQPPTTRLILLCRCTRMKFTMQGVPFRLGYLLLSPSLRYMTLAAIPLASPPQTFPLAKFELMAHRSHCRRFLRCIRKIRGFRASRKVLLPVKRKQFTIPVIIRLSGIYCRSLNRRKGRGRTGREVFSKLFIFF